MSVLTAHLIHRPHMPHPDLHRIADAVHHVQQKAHTVLEAAEKHECPRYEFLEDALMAREMRRL